MLRIPFREVVERGIAADLGFRKEKLGVAWDVVKEKLEVPADE